MSLNSFGPLRRRRFRVLRSSSVGGYAALSNYTSLGGQLTVFALP
jgi:hypothetical protein